ncbi:MAG: ABC transporter permease [Hyphomicrobiales bacterium]
MSEAEATRLPPARPEFERRVTAPIGLGDVAKPLSFLERLGANVVLRRGLILVATALVWELYARWLDSPITFPTFLGTLQALRDGILSGVIPQRLAVTLETLVIGDAIGLLAAALVTTIAVTTRIGTDLLSTFTAMFNPLPAIALLPLALLWFGLGRPSLVFVIVHSVLWAVALNMHSGFLSVSETLRMTGRTFGLSGVRLVFGILMPAAFPSVLAGLKIGWAFAWRTLIAAELVFGVSSGQGGLGWYIFENRYTLDTASVFAGLLTVMAVGLLVEGVIFRFIEARSIRRWGMQSG